MNAALSLHGGRIGRDGVLSRDRLSQARLLSVWQCNTRENAYLEYYINALRSTPRWYTSTTMLINKL